MLTTKIGALNKNWHDSMSVNGVTCANHTSPNVYYRPCLSGNQLREGNKESPPVGSRGSEQTPLLSRLLLREEHGVAGSALSPRLGQRFMSKGMRCRDYGKGKREQDRERRKRERFHQSWVQRWFSQLRSPIPVDSLTWGYILCPFVILAPPSGGHSNSLG